MVTEEYRELVKLARQAVDDCHLRAPRIVRALERAERELNPPASGYPEHDKLTKVSDRTQAAGDFAEWAGEQGYQLMHWYENGTEHGWVVSPPVTELLAKWAGIDQTKLEAEKRDMLDTLRAQQVNA